MRASLNELYARLAEYYDPDKRAALFGSADKHLIYEYKARNSFPNGLNLVASLIVHCKFVSNIPRKYNLVRSR